VDSLKPRSAIARAGAGAVAGLALGLAVFLAVFYFGPIYSLTTYAPVQPVKYSHKLHAGDLNIPCQYCHAYARRSEMAGIPSMSKCMNCHSNLTSRSGDAAKLAAYFGKKEAVAWARVYNLPDHVWFSHKRHVSKDIDCKECHGAVDTLEVNARLRNFKMGFCVTCHQKNGAPTDCWTCHT